MKLRYRDTGLKNKDNKPVNKRPKVPVSAVVLLSGALAAGAAACGTKVPDAPKEKQVVVETKVDLDSVSDLSERDALLAYMIKNNMRDISAKLPVIDYPQGLIDIELIDGKDVKANLTFVQYVKKKRDEPAPKEGEPSGKDKLIEMGCETWEAQMATSEAQTVPMVRCADLESVKRVCEAACEEKNPNAKANDKDKKEAEEGEEEKPQKKESKDTVMEYCNDSCFGGALTSLMKNDAWFEAVDMYDGLLGNGHCDDDQWGRLRVIIYETDEQGNMLLYDLKGNLVTYDENGDVAKYNEQGQKVIEKDKDGNVIEHTEKDIEKAKPKIISVQTATVLVGTEQGDDIECPRGKGGKAQSFEPPPTAVAGKTGQK